jgi:hypothetical protein
MPLTHYGIAIGNLIRLLTHDSSSGAIDYLRSPRPYSLVRCLQANRSTQNTTSDSAGNC